MKKKQRKRKRKNYRNNERRAKNERGVIRARKDKEIKK
jgi:hypothetical protein